MKKKIIILSAAFIILWCIQIVMTVHNEMFRVWLMLFYVPAITECLWIMYDSIKSEQLSKLSLEHRWKYTKIAIIMTFIYMVTMPVHLLFQNFVDTSMEMMTTIYITLPALAASILIVSAYFITHDDMREVQKQAINMRMKHEQNKLCEDSVIERHEREKIEKRIQELKGADEELDYYEIFIKEQDEILAQALEKENLHFLQKMYYTARRNNRVGNRTYIKENRFSYRITKPLLYFSIAGVFGTGINLLSEQISMSLTILGICLLVPVFYVLKARWNDKKKIETSVEYRKIRKVLCIISLVLLIVFGIISMFHRISAIIIFLLYWLPGIGLNLIAMNEE